MTDARTPSTLQTLRHDLVDIVRAALAGVHAGRLVRAALVQHAALFERAERLHVIAVGKAAVPMAASFAGEHGPRIGRAMVIAPEGHGVAPQRFEQWPGGHPVPDETSRAAAIRALEIARLVRRDDDLLVVLLSGGASALMALPAPGIDLAAKAQVTAALLGAGVPIEALNCVRRHLSAIKGGRLGAAARASVTLAVSDVVGPPPDDPSAIGSGPTVPDPTTFADALAAIDEAGVGARVPREVRALLERGCRREIDETIKPSDPRLARSVYRLIGTRAGAIDEARRAAESRGYTVLQIDQPVVGEARAAGAWLMATVARWLPDVGRPFCLLSAGETTVRVRGTGKGGRNQELALAAAIAGLPTAVFACASIGTDGTDGPTDAAGAIVDSTTLARAANAGLGHPALYLDNNDSYRFFDPLGDLLRTGPTETNVGDLQVVLVA